MKKIVISAVNLKVGGTLTILRDCLRYLSALAETGEYQIIALVYDRKIADYPHIEYIELQWPKKNWINRLWCEYVAMRKISVQLAPVYLWLSLHDTTPHVKAQRRAVYCHNSFPFYRWKIQEILFAPRIVLFSLFSKYAYRMNIHKNKYVIVQQQWFREAFVHWFHLPEESVIVAPPVVRQEQSPKEPVKVADIEPDEDHYSFIYAATSDSHKNFECICRAAVLLQRRKPELKFKVYITVKGDENAYTRWLFSHWGDVPGLAFIGYLSKEQLYAYYQRSNCLIFASKVETWGLPITEFAVFNKPMLLSDLPYAHETAAGCEQVAFFHPDRPQELAGQMAKLLQGENSFLATLRRREVQPPVAESWKKLFHILLR